jgi:hypothetical protein
MKRRSRPSDEPAKAQRRKTGARKSGITPKAARSRSSRAAREETNVARLNLLKRSRSNVRSAAGWRAKRVRVITRSAVCRKPRRFATPVSGSIEEARW